MEQVLDNVGVDRIRYQKLIQQEQEAMAKIKAGYKDDMII